MGLIAVLPIAVDWIAKNVVWPRPFWVWFFDPETPYFYNGLRLLRRQAPYHVDHPGTTLQMLSAAIAALSGPTPLRYEAFLTAAHLLALVLILAATALLLATILREAPPALQIAGAWTYFMAPQALALDDVWSPELVYLPIAAVVFALLWRWWRVPGAVPAIFLGLALGLAVATKFTFLAWIPAALAACAVARQYRDAIVVAAAAAAGFAIGTIPAACQYERMLQRLFVLGTQPRVGMEGGTWLVLTAKGWFLWVVVIVVFAATRLRRRHLPMLTFVVVAIGLNYVGMLRNASFKHLLPSCLAFALLFALSVSAPPSPRVSVQAGVLGLCALLTGRAVINDIGTHRRRIAEHLSLRAQIEAAVPRDAVALYSWRVPIPSFALRAVSDDWHHAEIERRYPLEGHFDSSGGHFDRPRGRVFLPLGRRRWDYLVIDPQKLHDFPEPVGGFVARVGPYVVVRAPDSPKAN
jgi:hypothetical protein